MDLFENSRDPDKNLLPGDGTVNYFGPIFSWNQSNDFYQRLFGNIEWKNDETFIFQRLIITKRKVAWYGDHAFSYTYSHRSKTALPWTPDLIFLKNKIELLTGETFNSCLLNLYHSGEEGMAWHSDREKDLKKDGAIASLTFGAERSFAFKHKTKKQTISILLEHGSLLVMKGTTQTFWLHRLPTAKKVLGPRINLTFRTIMYP